jgi:hypothetical protein
MGFKENLLKKVRIDTLSEQVHRSMGPSDGDMRMDKTAMAELLALGGFPSLRERDLDLYVLAGDDEQGRILVLDNELPIYQTSALDIGLRKSPTLKEMVRIRSIIKILSDADVVVSRKTESLRAIQNQCLGMLDLSFGEPDIAQIATEGMASLDGGDVDGVRESLGLFAELLGYREAPRPFNLPGVTLVGPVGRGERGETVLGPVVVYAATENRLLYLDVRVKSRDTEGIKQLHRMATGRAEPTEQGIAVFRMLKEFVPAPPQPDILG